VWLVGKGIPSTNHCEMPRDVTLVPNLHGLAYNIHFASSLHQKIPQNLYIITFLRLFPIILLIINSE
jgi:hypothetical protein